MDKNFLEFWGNFLLSAARGKKQVEDMNEWIGQGLKGSEGLSNMFQKSYGLDKAKKDDPDYMETWNRASENFLNSFRDYLNLLGVVPGEEHLSLVEKYEKLKEKVVSQEETIKHLKKLLNTKSVDEGGMLDGYQSLMEKQTAEFQELTKNLGRLFQTEIPNAKTTKKRK